jgi:DNA-binding NtrC family response regulator
VPELALSFMRNFAQRCQKELSHIEDDAMILLKGYPWPGNIRQLENVIERAVVICEKPYLSVQELPEMVDHALGEEELQAAAAHTTESPPRLPRARAEREQLEREQLVRALAAADGNKAEAARAMGVARSTLVSRLKKLGLS